MNKKWKGARCLMAIKSSGSSSKVPHIFGIFMDRWEKIKGAAAYVNPLGLYRQSTRIFLHDNLARLTMSHHLVIKRITGQQLFSSMNYRDSIFFFNIDCQAPYRSDLAPVAVVISVIRCREVLFVLLSFSCCVGYSTSHTSQELRPIGAAAPDVTIGRTAVSLAWLWTMEGGHYYRD